MGDKMRATISRQTLIAAIGWGIIAGAEYIYMSSTTWEMRSIITVSIIAIVNIMLQLGTLKCLKLPFISFFSALLIFLYLFHFGQVFITAFFNDVEFKVANYLDHYATNKVLAWKTIEISLICINCIFIGGILSSNKSFFEKSHYDIDKSEKIDGSTLSYRICYYMGRVLIVMSLPFRLYIDIRQLITAAKHGYVGVYSLASFSGVFSAIAGFFYIAIALIYLTTENKKHKKLLIYVSMAYITITMLTGNRGHQVINIIGILLVIYIDSGVKISVKKVLLYFIVGFFSLTFLDMIFNVRHDGIDYFLHNFSDILKGTMKKNIFLETINNFGSTVFTPYIVLEKYGNTLNPFFGEAFIKSFASVVPDIGGVFRNINREAIYSQVLNSPHQIGGSLVGEFYYNFGQLYWIAGLVFGFVYHRVSSKIFVALKSKQYSVVCYTLPFAVYSLWWVRDTIGGVTRSVVWLLIIYALVKAEVTKRSKIIPEE